MIVRRVFYLLICFVCVSFQGNYVHAELQSLKGLALPVPRGLEPRILFWVDVFARYGEHHEVYHHRDYPEITYSVLDFTSLKDSVKGAAFARAKQSSMIEEKSRIQKALRNLAKGRTPADELERRIVTIFKATVGANKRQYERAALEENIRSQTGIKEKFRDAVIRSSRYLYAMEEVFTHEGLPLELTRLPYIESSFNYKARSSVGAAGIWQFMPATGRSYMRVNNAIDERLDPIVASRGAAKYLADAYRRLQSWPLAVTSYNHGVGGMMRAVKETGTRDIAVIIERYQGRAFKFASKNFYIELLAAIEVDKNWRKYFPDAVKEPPLLFDEIKLSRSIGFSDLRARTGFGTEILAELNYSFKDPILRGWQQIPAGYVLKTPRGTGNQVLAKLGSGTVYSIATATTKFKEEIGKAKSGTDWEGRYRVQRGDSLGKIANRFGVSQSELAEANAVKSAHKIVAGQLLKIPEKNKKQAPVLVAERTSPAQVPQASATESYVVKSGDTVGSIAQKFGVATKSLMSANGISDPRKLKAGQRLKLGGVTVTSTSSQQKNTASAAKMYTVKKGDTLFAISKRTGVTLAQLRQKNPGLNEKIKPGQTIQY